MPRHTFGESNVGGFFSNNGRSEIGRYLLNAT
ncbi:MAG: hypothetical protein ACI92G_000878, partial [Candidatus Pelagisphaera sp.]